MKSWSQLTGRCISWASLLRMGGDQGCDVYILGEWLLTWEMVPDEKAPEVGAKREEKEKGPLDPGRDAHEHIQSLLRLVSLQGQASSCFFTCNYYYSDHHLGFSSSRESCDFLDSLLFPFSEMLSHLHLGRTVLCFMVFVVLFCF